MGYYKTWMDKSEDASNRQEYMEYINRYYALEKVAYEKIALQLSLQESSNSLRIPWMYS